MATSDPLERCGLDCPKRGSWGATGKLPEQHTWQPNERGGYLAHLHNLGLDDLVRLYGVRCAETHAAASESTALFYFESAESIGREISRRWDQLVKQNRDVLLRVQDVKIQMMRAQEDLMTIMRAVES
jgi:hypothetical protein